MVCREWLCTDGQGVGGRVMTALPTDTRSWSGATGAGSPDSRALSPDSRARSSALTTEDLREVLHRLPLLDTVVDDSERIDQIGLLESIKAAAAAAQARVTIRFAESQREAQALAGLPARDRGRGVAAQVALARRDSPARGSRHLGLAEALVRE